MHTLFISDLHLSADHRATTDILLRLLQTEAGQTDALYILGDFFDAFVGDDVMTPFHEEIIAALRAFAGSTPVYFMPGNRDFLVGPQFAKRAGWQVLADPTVISLYGVPTLLMHGDSLCTQDVAYQRFRKIVRCPVVQWLFLHLSKKMRGRMAERLRDKSRAATRMKADNILDVAQEAVETVMRQAKVLRLIHGHTHRPARHEFMLDGERATRVVLGDWHESGQVWVCEASGEQHAQILRP